MKHQHRTERGQALILIVVGMMGLLGATALAVDGGEVYSDRRHAQNAADTAVMAAGLSIIRDPAHFSVAQTAALNRAADNGYDNNLTSNVVNVYRCSDVGATCTLPAGETHPESYVQVTISSTVPMHFARVLGVPEVTNFVQAMAKAIPPSPTHWANGAALVALMPGCKGGGWPNDPFEVGGSSVSIIGGSGVFVNSTCDRAFINNGSPSFTAANGDICVLGGGDSAPQVNPQPTYNCPAPQIDPQTYALPPVSLDSCRDSDGNDVVGEVTTIGAGYYVATPGMYNSTFPGVSPAGHLQLVPGIYCLRNGLSLGTGSWDITTDLNGNGTYDGTDASDPPEGVLFYVDSGGVTFNGSSTVHIGAQNKAGTPEGIKGYLIYMPPTNNSTIKMAGNNDSQFIGTILAPSGFVTLEGSNDLSNPVEYDCQIISYSIRITGNGYMNIVYDQSQNGRTWTNAVLKPYK